METTKGLKMVALFTHEANRILSQSIHLLGSSVSGRREEGNLDTVLEPDVTPPSHVINIRESSMGHVTTSQELYCQSCHAPLANREEQVTHYQLDWHRYNLKKKLKGLPPVSQEEFERIAGDLSSISGSESSSSDTAEEGKEGEAERYARTAGSPLLQFVTADGTVFAVYRSVITNSKVLPAGGEVVEQLCALREPQVWVVLMRAGGHFAGAVFNGSMVVAHKTFHRYTVRAKRGTAQSVRDSQQGGHQPKSAGASLRRYNEMALVQEIQQLISSWSQFIEGATAIFIRTPKYSKGVFTGGGQAPFSKDDPRIRGIPFATRRPTLKEVKSVHFKLAALYSGFTRNKQDLQAHQKSPKCSDTRTRSTQPVLEQDVTRIAQDVVVESIEDISEVGVADRMDEPIRLQYEDDEEQESDEKTVQRKKKKKGGKKSSKSAAAEALKSFPAHIQQLLTVCVDGCEDQVMADIFQSMSLAISVPALITSEADQSETEEESTGASPVNPSNEKVDLSDELNRLWNGETLLHVAAVNGHSNLVSFLLHRGADPATKNAAGHTTYFIARDKQVRDAFRRFMACHPGRYDYEVAQVPSALTEEMERERREKQLEKKKVQRKAKKQKERECKAEREMEALKDSQQVATSALSEREKRAMAAERRLAKQLPADSTITRAGVCVVCGTSLAGLVPFERLQFKYCSMDCLKTHRTHLQNN